MIRLQPGCYLAKSVVVGDFAMARILETSYSDRQSLPRHAHEHAYLVVMTSGSLRETCRGREQTLARGDMVFNAIGEAHQDDVAPGGARCLNIELRPALLARLRDAGCEPSAPMCYSEALVTIPAVGQLCSALAAPGNEADVEIALVELLAATVAPRERRLRRFAWLPRAIDFVRATYREGVRLEAMADAVGVDRFHLCRSFRQATGCTIGEYARRLRADLAYQRLTIEGASLATVAFDCGFADQSHMTREVSRLYGRSPARLRQGRKPPG
ncbi:MAG: helix-turn-helix transcriptional regulator [Planctomycetes bacterium]|nr:helix-turn-helix transcriptional regulator [Planctomycetota bacterium]